MADDTVLAFRLGQLAAEIEGEAMSHAPPEATGWLETVALRLRIMADPETVSADEKAASAWPHEEER